MKLALRGVRPRSKTRCPDSVVDVRRRARTATTAASVIAVALLAVVPACSSTSTPAAVSTSTTASTATSTTTSTSTAVTVPHESPAQVAACQSDASDVETALQAYDALHGAYPSPPSPWSAATYVGNFGPLTASTGGGPFLKIPPATTSYVIEYDSAGNVWVAPAGSYGAVYNPGQSFTANPDVCDVAG